MKKIIIAIIAIAAMINLVSCKKGPEIPTEDYQGENYTVEHKTVNGKPCVEIHIDNYDGLIEAYNDGCLSAEYVEEVLFNSQANNW